MEAVPERLSRTLQEPPAGGSFVGFLVFTEPDSSPAPGLWTLHVPASLLILFYSLDTVLEHQEDLLEELTWPQYPGSQESAWLKKKQHG